MQSKNTINKLLSYAENYIQLRSKVRNSKREYSFTKRSRSTDHIRQEGRKVSIPLSFTINNMIVDQKIGKLL